MLTRCADDGEAIKRMPWRVIMMVCGVTVLIAILEKAQGIDLLVSLVAQDLHEGNRDRRRRVPDRDHLGLQQHVGRRAAGVPADGARARGSSSAAPIPLAIAASMNVGGHLVDVSPLSTIGALCVAGAPADESRQLFNKLLAWGLSMCGRRLAALLPAVRLNGPVTPLTVRLGTPDSG